MYLFSIIIFIIASIICAITNDVVLLAIFRAIQACGASAGQSVGKKIFLFLRLNYNHDSHTASNQALVSFQMCSLLQNEALRMDFFTLDRSAAPL